MRTRGKAACHHLPRFIVEDEDFPAEIERVVYSAFLQTDSAFAEACFGDESLASGKTALAALVPGSRELVDEALKRKIGDNLAVVVVCFQSDPPPSLIAPRARVQRSISAEGLRDLQTTFLFLG